MKNITVKKRDGTVEPWSDDKLVSSIAKTGISIEQAENIATQVREWIQDNTIGTQTTSTIIRDLVIRYLSYFDIASAGIYETYKKPVT